MPRNAYEVHEVVQTREALETLARVPLALTAELTHLKSVAQPVWTEAKSAKNYPHFAPYLKQIVALTRELAEAIGFEAHPYDALLKQYEPGMTAAQLGVLFAELRTHVLPLLERIREAPCRRPPTSSTNAFPKTNSAPSP